MTCPSVRGMRMVLAAALVMMLGRAAVAEVSARAVVVSLDDADGKLVDAAVVKRVPNTTRCFGGREATVEVTLAIQDSKLVEATASGSGDAKLDACVQKLVKKMKLASSSAHVQLQISARKPIDPKMIDRIMQSQTAMATVQGAQPTLGTGTGVGTGTGTSRGGGTGGGSGATGQIVMKPADATLGAHSVEEIDRVFRSRAGVFRACYQREVAHDPKLAGKLVYTITIDENGAVTRVEQKPSTLKSKAVAACMSSQLKRLKFAAKGKAIVTYPFVFASAQ